MRYLSRILSVIVLSYICHAQVVSVQWTTDPAQGFQLVKEWENLPIGKNWRSFSDPGWVAAIKIDHRIICCCDHYAVIQHPKVISYCWRDDKRFYQMGAEVCSYNPISCKYFGEWKEDYWNRKTENSQTYPLSSFVAPEKKYIRDGLYVGNTLWQQHQAYWEKP